MNQQKVGSSLELEVHSSFYIDEEILNNIVWSPNGKLLASSSNKQNIRTWSTEKKEMHNKIEVREGIINDLSWSHDSCLLALAMEDGRIQVIDVKTGEITRLFEGHSGSVTRVAWSPTKHKLVSLSLDNKVRFWNLTDKEEYRALEWKSSRTSAINWSPDGRTVSYGATDNNIYLLDDTLGKWRAILEGHSQRIVSLDWSPDGQNLVSGSEDKTIVIWKTVTWQCNRTNILHGHTGEIVALSFSHDGNILASRSLKGRILFWRCDTWEIINVINVESDYENWKKSIAFNPKEPLLAVLDKGNSAIRILKIDVPSLLRTTPIESSVYYSNAKAVLVGETGTGKTCVARALMRQEFEPQESTHGMKVWSYRAETISHPKGGKLTRETFLWDLAGQTDYQVIHQLFLDKTALGIVVFDPTNIQNPFSGVAHWEKALIKAVGKNYPKLLVLRNQNSLRNVLTCFSVLVWQEKHNLSNYQMTNAVL